MMISERDTSILRLVMDEKVLRRMAWHRLISEESSPEELFLYLVGSWVIHSELGLDHDIAMNAVKLQQALDEGGIPYGKENEGFRLSLEHVRVLAHTDSGGETLFSGRTGSVRVSLSGPSIVRLIRFADAVLPEAERMVSDRALRIKREELASTFASRVLRERLDGLGLLYKIDEYCDHLKVEILLPPDGKLTFSFKAEEVDRIAGHIHETVSAAQTLHDHNLTGLFFRPLERWDYWAEPFNRKEK